MRRSVDRQQSVQEEAALSASLDAALAVPGGSPKKDGKQLADDAWAGMVHNHASMVRTDCHRLRARDCETDCDRNFATD